MRNPSLIKRRRKTAAFTMLELTVVLSVLGILMALAAPQFSRARDSNSVRSAMSDLVGAFSLARQTAVHQRALAAVVIDTVGGRVAVRLNSETIVVRELGTAYGVLLGATRDSAVYDAKGLAYGVSNLSVTIRRGARADTLTMSRMGRIR